MRVIDIDPTLLRKTADAARHAAAQATTHIDLEIKGVIPELVETLTPQGPYAYTILPEVHPDGSVKLPILTTREEITDAYRMIRGFSNLLSVVPLAEVRGSWYVFQDNISRASVKETGEQHAVQTLALFPCGRGAGITGELIWVRVPRSDLGGGTETAGEVTDEMLLREQVLQQHEQYVRALQTEDVEGVLAGLHDGVASAVRDYVHDTGTSTTLEGLEAHRDYYRSFFDNYEIHSVEPLYRIAEDWYIFAELRITATLRRGASGTTVAFHTAEFHMPANDGRIIARIGHGTDPE
jgi:hypothetical protein